MELCSYNQQGFQALVYICHTQDFYRRYVLHGRVTSLTTVYESCQESINISIFLKSKRLKTRNLVDFAVVYAESVAGYLTMTTQKHRRQVGSRNWKWKWNLEWVNLYQYWTFVHHGKKKAYISYKKMPNRSICFTK